MSNLDDKDQEWKTISRRSLRSTAKIRTGETPMVMIIGTILAVIMGGAWLIYLAPHLATEARHIYFSYPFIHIFIDSADEFVQPAIVLSTLLVICVAYIIGFVVQLQIDKITQPSRDKERRQAQQGANVRGVR